MLLYELTTSHTPKALVNNRDVVLNLIKKYCSDYYSILRHNPPLYRSLSVMSGIPDIFIANSREDRVPKDTALMYQEAIDKKLKEAGFNALRGNSIFCISDVGGAYFSKKYIIFPINGFNYTWCPTADLTEKYELTYGNWDTATENLEDMQFKSKMGDDYSANVALTKKPEYKMYYDLLDLTPKEFVVKYKFTNQNLNVALDLGYEVYVHGQYIAIYDNIWKDWYYQDDKISDMLGI